MVTLMVDIRFFVTAFILLLFSIILHELAHWLYIIKIKAFIMKPQFYRFGVRFTSPELTYNEQKNFILFGILAGMMPLFYGLGLPHRGYMLLFPIYFAGCRHDLTELFNLIRKELKK